MANESAEFVIYEAWQKALQADAVLISFVPAANILIGPRSDDAPIPGINITQVGGSYEIEDVQGTNVTGGPLRDSPVFQFEVAIDGEMPLAIEITEAIRSLLMVANAILSAVGICCVKKVGMLEYHDPRGLLCISPRYSFTYAYKNE